MKRLFALALALVILAVPALADENPLADFSMEQLQGTAALIQAEILRRAGEPFTVWPGQYVIGEDIPAGVYRVELQTGGSGWFWVYAQAGDAVPVFEGTLSNYEDVGAPIIGKVSLAAGNFLDVSVAVILSAYTGVGK